MGTQSLSEADVLHTLHYSFFPRLPGLMNFSFLIKEKNLSCFTMFQMYSKVIQL